ncbi:MAG: SAM-dependent methyltransferase [Anaerobacillus sp.]
MDLIANEIQLSSEHAITFERYMSLALYHKEYGYYNRDQPKTGKQGDFFTSTGVHDIYARMMAKVLTDDFQLEQIQPVIVDVGSGDGRFINAFLNEVQMLDANLYDKLAYYVIESSPYHQRLIKERTASNDIHIYSSLFELKKQLPKLQGILFSNELLDAFPVRIVEKYEGELLEVCVGLDEDGNLTELYKPCTDEEVITWLSKFGFEIENHQRMEIPLKMTKWLNQIGEWLVDGRVYTVDYGYTHEEWRDPARWNGSLRGYRNHHMINNPLQNPGEMDLTTHVPIDALKVIGEQCSLTWVSCEPQGKFLIKHGLLDFLQNTRSSDPFSSEHKRNRAVNWLSQSNQFYVIVQEKRRY